MAITSISSDIDGLTRQEHRVIMKARRALRETIEEGAGPHSNQLVLSAVCVAGAFADLLSSVPVNDEIVGAVNLQLATVGLELVRRPRN